MLISQENTPSSPFYNPFGGHRFKAGKKEFHIACARGYNAGIIGTERNGIFILCHSTRQVVLDEHMSQRGCWQELATHNAKIYKEISRIVGMSESEFSNFLNSSLRLRFNPFEESKERERIKPFDKNIRKQYSAADFTDAQYMTAAQQRKVVHDFEKFLVAALFSNQETIVFDKFTAALYNLMHLRMGYIAHYSRAGFYSAQLDSESSRMAAIKMIAKGLNTYGTLVRVEAKEEAMWVALKKMASYYVDLRRKSS